MENNKEIIGDIIKSILVLYHDSYKSDERIIIINKLKVDLNKLK
jgi:hypothetical protein